MAKMHAKFCWFLSSNDFIYAHVVIYRVQSIQYTKGCKRCQIITMLLRPLPCEFSSCWWTHPVNASSYVFMTDINTDTNIQTPCVTQGEILVRSNNMQQYAGIYLLQNYSTRFGSASHPLSGVHKNVTAASGTGHITYLCNNCSGTMTCTRGCSYSFMYSWWWVRWTPETCRVISQ